MTQEFRKTCNPLALAVTAVTLSLSPCLQAADWKISPSLDLSETYTDNVRLSSGGVKKSDFITQVSPGLSVSRTGPRLKANLFYLMQNRAYAREDSQIRTSHQLNAHGNAELIEHFFFLDGIANLSQQNVSMFGAQPANNTNITGNRASIGTYSISPYLLHRFDSIATSELRFAHDEVKTRVGGLSNSKGNSVLFNLNSGAAFRKLGWGLHYNKRTTDYNNGQSIETESASADLRLHITPKFSLTASKGREKNNYLSIASRPEGGFWTAGFSWEPTRRTTLEASTGNRFFGKTHSFMASHRSRNTVWSINYSEDITSSRSQFLIPATIDTANFLNHLWAPTIPDQNLRQVIVDDFIHSAGLPTSLSENVNYLTNRYFLQKRLQASVAINTAKSTLVLSAFDARREAQTAQGMDSILLGSGSLSLNDSTKQTGGNAMWNWRFAPRTNINVSVGHTKSRSISAGITDINKTMMLGVTHQLSTKLKGSVNFRRLQRDTTQSSGNYRENAVTANLHMIF